MKQKRIGTSQVLASPLILGTHAIGGGQAWGNSDRAEAIRTVQRAGELGINTIDLAPMYGYGECERVVGEAIRGQRGKYVLITKCGLQLEPEGSLHGTTDGRNIYRNLSPKAIRRQLEQSLLNMGTDYVDIYLTHWQSDPGYDVPVADTMGELCRMKEEGKILAIGLSNASPEEILDYSRYGKVDAVQNRYSLLYRNAEKDVFPLCEQYHISYMAYSSMEMGLLTGRVSMEYQVPEGHFRNRIRWFEPARRKMLNDMLEGWRPLCEKYDCAISDLSIALTISQRPYIFPLCGARKVFQIEENAKGGMLELDETDMRRMNNDVELLLRKESKLTPDPRYRF